MKKFLVLFMTAALLLSVSVSCLAAEMRLSREEIPPLAEDSAEAAGLKRLGILRGTDNGLELGRNVTRAEAVMLIWRTAGAAFDDIGYLQPSFSDISGHWAEDAIEKFYHAGFVNGTGEATFEPDRFVTGQEFVKILLTVMGYDGVTLENAYEKGKETEVLSNNFTKSVVYNNENLLRGDAARLCFSAFTAKTPEGEMLYKKMVKSGLYEESDFEGVLFIGCGTPAAYQENFVDKLNAQMPEDKNYMFSPLSVKMAFAMAANGAGGETKTQILNALGIEDLENYNQTVKTLIDTYNQSDILKFNIANSIWMNEDQTTQNFSEAFQKVLSENYNARAGKVTKANALDTINGWVDKQTNGKIKSIISDSDFWAMLVNAVYFKGAWENEFNKGATGKEAFTDRNGVQTDIDFMHKTSYINYYKNSDLEVIELPYKNSAVKLDENGGYRGADRYDFDVSMYAVKGEYHDAALKEIAEGKLSRTYVALSFPKFRVDFSADLNDCMKNIGITDAFDDQKADFKAMFDSGNMWITNTMHKTFIEVDEKGTEAAAVTSIGMAGSSLPPQPVTVKFNEPFTFVIRDNTIGEVLFLGEYAFAK